MFLLRSTFPSYFSGKYALYLINFTSLFILLIAAALLFEQYLEYKVYQFDINHDLIFSPEEQTAEQQKYWMWYIGDGGRKVFAPIIALLVSLASTFILYIIVKLFRLKN